MAKKKVEVNTQAENADMDFEEMMEQRIRNNFNAGNSATNFSDERLANMNKKLPDWDLVPPSNFLK